MALISSPIDGAPMRQIYRYGIEFDVCPTSGGIWLDKGELEKLIALVKEEVLHENGGSRERYRDDDDDDDRGRSRQNGGRRKSLLSDLFDF
jgi:uncharacterized protein